MMNNCHSKVFLSLCYQILAQNSQICSDLRFLTWIFFCLTTTLKMALPKHKPDGISSEEWQMIVGAVCDADEADILRSFAPPPRKQHTEPQNQKEDEEDYLYDDLAHDFASVERSTGGKKARLKKTVIEEQSLSTNECLALAEQVACR